MWSEDKPSPLEPEVFTPAGVPACSTPVLKGLAGKSGKASQKLVELGGFISTLSFLDTLH